MKKLNLLGFDFGASSGRAMLGVFDGERIEIEEIHRFSNDPVMLCGRFVWDVPRLVYEMKQALLKLSRKGVHVDAIGIDTWGVDFGMLDKNGHLLGLPVHYRDDRTLGMREKVREIIPDKALFAHTGLAYNQFNTLYQLYAMKLEGDPVLEQAADLLFMPDLLAYFLTGKKGTEYTVASTSELINPYTRDWDKPLMEMLGLPTGFLGEVKLPGTVRGTLLKDIAKECGVDGSIRLLKNIMGLWIIQECKREWDRRSDAVGFAELVEMAVKAPAFKAVIDVDDPCFMAPGDMPNRIQAYCERTGQAVPKGRGEISRVIYESLALKYRWAVERLEEVLGHPVKVLHIVGGGSKNALLNRFTAEAIKRPVVAGPGEGTVIGNLLMQAKALGAIADIPELRRVVEASFPTETFLPETDGSAWDAAYAEYVRRYA